MKTFLKENVSPGELEIYKILSILAPKYNDRFSTLVLPHALEVDEESHSLTLPYYEGELFNGKWDESNGGLPLGLDLSKEVPLILKDLSKIDIALIISDKKLLELPKVAFNFAESVNYYENIIKKFKSSNLISSSDYLKIEVALHHKQTSRIIFNNGDFYFRNFIRKRNGKIVLIDWETWNDHSPFYILDHPENIAAVPFVHMWGDEPWQKAYQVELNKHFSFSKDSFNKALVMESLDLANFWFRKKSEDELVMDEIKILKQVLNQVH